MFRLNDHINNLESKNKYAIYLSIFRLFICFHLLKDIYFGWGFIDILYKSNSFIPPIPTLLDTIGINTGIIRSHFNYFFIIYIFLISLYFFGIGKNITALSLFIFYDIYQRLNPSVLNGGDNLLKFIMLYMVFTNSYNYFSISTFNSSNIKIRKISNLVSNLAAISIPIHLCLAYLWSAFGKIHADVWYNGVATYYILSLERFKGTPFNETLVKNGVFVTLTTYYTIFVELLFPFLVWFKQTKKIMIVCGITIHLGIYVFMMIYDFQFVFMMTYGFFFSNCQWATFINRKRKYFYNIFRKIFSKRKKLAV